MGKTAGSQQIVMVDCGHTTADWLDSDRPWAEYGTLHIVHITKAAPTSAVAGAIGRQFMPSCEWQRLCTTTRKKYRHIVI